MMSLEDEIKNLTGEIRKLNSILSKKEGIKNNTLLSAKDYIDIPEFCRRLNICKSTFYKLIKNRSDFKMTKIGKRTLISEEQYDDVSESLVR